MYKRSLETKLKELVLGYPVITLNGPRQSGKTTLVRSTFPNKPYVNFENLSVLERAMADPMGFLEKYPEGAIFDEIQRAPKLLSYIQVVVDEKNKKGMFILTGSHQLSLHASIAQSLAGRTAILSLLPMSIAELKIAGFSFPIDEILLKGGYPRIFKENLEPGMVYKSYLQTYIERDLRQLINIKDLSKFQKFLKLLAGRIGQIINFESLANDADVSSKTIKEWIGVLEASFVIFQLRPYFENFGKRVIKSPKIYFQDVGLASYLLNIENINQINRDPLRGNLIENLIILELMKYRFNIGKDANLYFFRDTRGNEVDVLFKKASSLIPIEIKSAKTFRKEFLKNLMFFHKTSKRSSKGFVVYLGKEEQRIKDFHLINYQNATKALL